MGFEQAYEPLLARRIPRDAVVPGRAYVIHARNGGVGVAVLQGERLGYELHREKFGQHYLFVEWDWAEGPPYGTAIPLEVVAEAPPSDKAERLAWLAVKEGEHRQAIDAAWAVVLGRPPPAG